MRVLLAVPLLSAFALGACGDRPAAANGAPRGGSAAPPASRFSPAIGQQSAAALAEPRAQIFLAKGCPQCHAITALGVTSPTNAGPDLTVAVTDVQSRFSTTIEEFLANPTGTMQIVLSAQIQLSPAERDSIVKLLRAISTNP